MIEQLLDDHHLNQETVYSLLSSLVSKTPDYADLYFQYSVAESWFLEESIVKSGTYNISHGVGARSVNGEQTGFAYSDDLNRDAIEKAIDFAKGVVTVIRLHQCKLFNQYLRLLNIVTLIR